MRTIVGTASHLFWLLMLPACSGESPATARFDPLDYQGLWTLSPAPQMTCNLPLLGTYTATFESVELDAAASGFDATVAMVVAGGLFTLNETIQLDVLLDQASGDMSAMVPISLAESGTGFSATMTGDFRLDGAFVEADEFEADLEATMDISLLTIGGTNSASCVDLSTTVTGVRTP